MIHFITEQGNGTTVENIMGYVNNYIVFNDMVNVKSNSYGEKLDRECGKLLEKITVLNSNYSINVEAPGVMICQGRSAKIKSLIKKIIKKCTRWYIADLAKQQTEFNANVVRYLNQEMVVVNEMSQEIKRLKEYMAEDKASQKGIPDEFYWEFENQFRGEESLIEERLGKYAEIFKECRKVVDLGCGRGEFLTILKENGINGIGVDCNSKMVSECEKKGLDVENGDCLDFLKKQKNIDGIFASQLVEHLSANKIYQLVKCAYDKLNEQGVLVIETVNPLSLGVYCYGFYIDPTHTVPIHPAMLRFMAEKIGFKVEPVEFINEFPEEYKFVLDEQNTSHENYITEKLNQQIYGAQDYYLVCRK